MHGQFVGLGAEHGADCADDIADIPALERGIDFLANLVTSHIKLDAPAHVGDGDERSLAHHTLQHDSPGNTDRDRTGFEFLAGFAVVPFDELAGNILAHKVVRIRVPAAAPFGKLGAAFKDDMVFVLLGRGGGVVLFGHGGVLRNK